LPLAAIGTAVIAAPAFSAGGSLAGDALGIAAGLAFAGYLIAVSAIGRRIDGVTLSAIVTVVSAITAATLALASHAHLTGFSSAQWSAMIALGLISQLGGYLAIGAALRRLPATAVSIGILGQGPIAVMLAIPLLHEPLMLVDVIGGSLVLIAIVRVIRAPQPKHAELAKVA
jgi:drug/metabolite transporter (DMT)-like permease